MKKNWSKFLLVFLLSLLCKVFVMGQSAPTIGNSDWMQFYRVETTEATLGIRYNRGERTIAFAPIGRVMNYLIVVDGNGKEMKINHSLDPKTRAYEFKPMSIDRFAGNTLIIKSCVDNHSNATININHEVTAFKAWKAEANLKKSLDGSLQEEIGYLKICPYSDHKTILENDIVEKKAKEFKDMLYVNENYPALKNRLGDKMLQKISSVSDCQNFLKYYDTYSGQAEEILYNLLQSTASQQEVDSYIKMFPNGKHTAEMKLYYKALVGGITDCATYISKYPNGSFVSEIKSRKQRLEQLQTNSNKSLWKMGNKICYCNTSGITMVTLDQWNEDKSAFKGIVIASPGGLYEGNILQKGNQLWIEPKNWHKCLDDEVSYALEHDKSAEAEKLLSQKNMKFRRGTIVSQTFEIGWLFRTSHTIQAKVEDWNEDFTKMKIQIVKTGGLSSFDGESIYEGKYIWTSPIGWH